MVTVSGVEEKSLAEKAGIISGDKLVSINGNDINDVLDYRFYITEKKLVMNFERCGKEFSCVIKKPQYDDIGLEFETYLMDEKHSCTNKCVFCFIDQNPEGMREQVYFKDDDSRMSFLYGNYVTLTNMKRCEVDRLVKMRISPINISVHTTNRELRCKMLNNRFAGEVLDYLDVFKDGEIMMNFQIVLCRGLNDGKELEKTLYDLTEYFPCVESIAVVPAGLTKHREGLYELSEFDCESAKQTIEIVDKARRAFEEKYGMPLVQCSDEWYLKAGIDVPGEDYYDGYPQLDNGVGVIRSQKTETLDRVQELKEDGFEITEKRKVSSVTGKAAFGFMSEMASLLNENFENLDYTVYCAENRFFGESVTVAGLLTGSDLLYALQDKPLGDELFIPDVMLRYEQDMFLDNMTLEELSEKLNVKITPVKCDGYDFTDKILGIE